MGLPARKLVAEGKPNSICYLVSSSLKLIKEWLEVLYLVSEDVDWNREGLWP